MWIEVHVCSVEAKSQAGNIWVKDMMKTQKGQSWRKSAKDHKNNYTFCWKIQQRALGPWESITGATYLWDYTQKVAIFCP